MKFLYWLMFYLPSNCVQATSTCISHYKYTDFGFLFHKLSRKKVIRNIYRYIYIRYTSFVFEHLLKLNKSKVEKNRRIKVSNQKWKWRHYLFCLSVFSRYRNQVWTIFNHNACLFLCDWQHFVTRKNRSID